MATVPRSVAGGVTPLVQAPVPFRSGASSLQERLRVTQQAVHLRERQKVNQLEADRRFDRLENLAEQQRSGLTYRAQGIEIQQQVDQAQALKSFARVAQGVGDLLTRRALEIRTEDNRREAKRMDLEFSGAISNKMFGAGDSPGFYSARGEQATGDVYQNSLDDLDKTRLKILQGASNGRVRTLFNDASQARLQRESVSMGKHVSKERMVANNATSEAVILEASNQAIRYHDDPFRVQQSIDVIDNEIVEMKQRMGWNPAVANIKRNEVLSGVHSSIIGAKMVGDPSAARTYFENSKHQVDPRLYGSIEKKLRASGTRQESQQAFDDIISRVGDEESALTLAKRIDKSEIRDATAVRVRQHFNDLDRIDKRQKDDKFNKIAVDAANGVEPKEEDFTDMSPRDRQYLKTTYRKQEILRKDPDFNRPGDGGETLADFMRAQGDPQSFGSMSFNELQTNYEYGVTKKTWEQRIFPAWVNAKNVINKGEAKRALQIEREKRKNEEFQFYGLSVAKRIDQAEKTLGISDNETLSNRFRVSFDDAINLLPGKDRRSDKVVVETLNRVTLEALASKKIAGEPYTPSLQKGEQFSAISRAEEKNQAFSRLKIKGVEELEYAFLKEVDDKVNALPEGERTDETWKGVMRETVNESLVTGKIAGQPYNLLQKNVGLYGTTWRQRQNASYQELGIAGNKPKDKNSQHTINLELDRIMNNLPEREQTTGRKVKEWNNLISRIKDPTLVVDPGFFYDTKKPPLLMTDVEKENFAGSLGIPDDQQDDFVSEFDFMRSYLRNNDMPITRNSFRRLWEGRIAVLEGAS